MTSQCGGAECRQPGQRSAASLLSGECLKVLLQASMWVRVVLICVAVVGHVCSSGWVKMGPQGRPVCVPDTARTVFRLYMAIMSRQTQ